MGVKWDLYEKLLRNGSAENKRDIVINDAVNSFTSGMVDDPAYQENAVVNGTVTPLTAARSSVIQCDIKAKPDTNIHIGDIVECYDEYWIVRELYIDKVGIINGVMWLCNENLRFQNKSDVIHEKPCVVDDGTYSKRTSDPDARVVDSTYKIYISIDEDTKRLYVDKRISLGKVFNAVGEIVLEVYKIIGIDFKSHNFGEGSHLMVLTIQRDVFNASADSIEHNICDMYFSSTSESIEGEEGYSAISGRDTIRLGTTRKYSASFVKSDGTKDDAATPAWNVLAPTGVTSECNANDCSITVPLLEEYVGSEIIISLTDNDGIYSPSEKKVQVISIG